MDFPPPMGERTRFNKLFCTVAKVAFPSACAVQITQVTVEEIIYHFLGCLCDLHNQLFCYFYISKVLWNMLFFFWVHVQCILSE